MQRACYACREWNYKWFANDLEEPYTTPDGKPFSWQGPCGSSAGAPMLGPAVGTASANRISTGGRSTATATTGGSYSDLAPYYGIVEDYVGISGQAEKVPSSLIAISIRRCR